MGEPATVLPEPWLGELEKQIEHVRVDGGASAVHAMRVAAGRMSVWIEIAGRHVLHDDLRWLRRSAATLRDIDVMLDAGRAPQWEAVLRLQRTEALAVLRAAIASTRPRALVLGLRCVPAPEVDDARKGTLRLARRVLKSGRRIAADTRDPYVIHRVRRRLRRLRYALEWLQIDSKDVKKTQDAFGAFHDRVVELRHLETQAEVSVPEADRLVIQTDLERTRKAAIESWDALRASLREFAQGDGKLVA
jgi:CHAD domain-containing protein